MSTCYLVHTTHVCTYTYLHAHTDMHTCKCRCVHAHLNIGSSILRMIISSLSMSYTVQQVKFEWSDCREERQSCQKATKAANVSPGIWRLLDRNRCSQALDTAPRSLGLKSLGESASFEEADNPHRKFSVIQDRAALSPEASITHFQGSWTLTARGRTFRRRGGKPER